MSVEPVDILVLAPHPDDEILMAGGVIARAKAEGKRVAVAIVTNGDLGCERDGVRREKESVAAIAKVGGADQVFFLGYPDGSLEHLGPVPLTPLPRRDLQGQCTTGNTTYAALGVGHTDVHTLFEGEPAVYTSASLTEDLTSLLDALAPRDVFVSHPIDEHPDHAFTYIYLRRALEHADVDPPTIHRALVHIGGCYPTDVGMPPCPEVHFDPTKRIPPLPPLYANYRPSEHREVPSVMQVLDPAHNPKYQAIAAYPSQTGPLEPHLSYLFSFARTDENFFPETLASNGVGGYWRSLPDPTTPGEARALGAWIEKNGGNEREVRQRAPIEYRLSDLTEDTTFDFMTSANAKEHYTVRITSDGLELRRVDATEDALLRRWILPETPDLREHDVSILVDDRPDDGGVAEISIRRDDELLGIAVDARPLLQGARVAVRGVAKDHVEWGPR